ncbi:hypothetical protein N0V88_005156 [Collariella sp. IMI 366227]|nr:hypothetical protein N0V88_005156 [Collariella sp. IMI 366227]
MAAVLHSMSYNLLLAEKAHLYTKDQLRGGQRVSSQAEASESKKAKAKALSALDSTLAVLDKTIRSLRRDEKRDNEAAATAREISVTGTAPTRRHVMNAQDVVYAMKPRLSLRSAPSLDTTSKRVEVGFGLSLENRRRRGARKSEEDSARAVMEAFLNKDTPGGLQEQQESMKDIAEAVRPIVNTFDSILEQPYIEEFSALLNIVPVVGIKNGQIVYLQAKLNEDQVDQTKDEWTFFSQFPDGATPQAGKAVHMFPFDGNFCMSVGTAVWRKRHREASSEQLQNSIDNWPEMYVNEWEKIGDKVLPEADLAAVVPFTNRTSDNKIVFKLVILSKDSATLRMLDKDDLYETGNTWSDLSWNGLHADKLTEAAAAGGLRMAYWNNRICAIDADGWSYDVKVNFEKKTSTTSDPIKLDPVKDLTANHIGPVVARDDGYLYQRVTADPSSEGDDPELRWDKWVKSDGVTNLGAASPGVQVDMRTMSATLKKRYMNAQAKLVPSLINLKGTAEVHDSMCGLLIEYCDQYNNGEDTAIDAGRETIITAKALSRRMSQDTTAGYVTVTNMTSELHGIKQQLALQLQQLKDNLEKLKRQLSAQEEQLSELKSYFWATIGAIFLGKDPYLPLSSISKTELLLFINPGIAVGLCSFIPGLGPMVSLGAIVAGGALFAGGLAGTISLAVMMEDLSNQISDTKVRIRSTSDSIDTLSNLSFNYGSLDTMYKSLNKFWGALWDDAQQILGHDDSVYELIGMEIFGIKSEIIAAQKVAQELALATKDYLEVLHEQGVPIDPPEKPPALKGRSVTKAWSSQELLSVSEMDLRWKSVEAADVARQHLDKRELNKFHAKLWESEMWMMQVRRRTELEPAAAGAWYDLPQLTNDAGLFNNPVVNGNIKPPQGKAGQARTQGGPVWDAITAVRNRINEAVRPTIVMLRGVTTTCQQIRELVDKYEKLKDEDDKTAIAALRDTLLQQAMETCQTAKGYSAEASNSFADINHALTDWQTELNRDIKRMNYEIDQLIADAEEKIAHGYPDWLAYAEIEGMVFYLTMFIAFEDGLGKPRAKLDGQTVTWKTMAQTVSGCLGSVYDELEIIYMLVEMDLTHFEDLMNKKWENIQNDTDRVLAILASVGIDINQTRGMGRRKRLMLEGGKVAPAQPKKPGDDMAVAKAMKAPDGLADAINIAAKEAGDFFDGIEKTFELPNLQDLVGFWDQEGAQKTSLLQIVKNLQHHYNDDMSTQQPAILGLLTCSGSAPFFAEEISGAKPPLLNNIIAAFLHTSEMPMNAAKDAAAKFETGAEGMKDMLRQLQQNLEKIQNKVKELDESIDKLETEERDRILNLFGDVVALVFATAGLLVGFGLLGPAMSVATILSMGAAATGALIKGTIDALNLAEIEELLAQTKAAKRDLDITHETLSRVGPLFTELTDHASGIASSATNLYSGLEDVQSQAQEWDQVTLSEQQLEEIRESWQAVYEACLKWLGVFAEQGGEPPTKFDGADGKDGELHGPEKEFGGFFRRDVKAGEFDVMRKTTAMVWYRIVLNE